MTARTIDQLEISRVWTMSTCHIRSEDSKALSQCRYLVVYEYPEGFWILVPPDAEMQEVLSMLPTSKLSSAITNILTIASSHEVEFVRIDADGPIYDFLSQFHW